MKADPIFNLRRCSALSLFSCLIWFGFIFLGSIISVFLNNPNIWVRFFFLGFYGAFMLRLLVYSITSFADYGRMLTSSLLQPVSCIISILFMGPVIGYDLGAHLLAFFLVSISVAVLAVFLFKYLLDRVGKRTLGMASSSLFKAFLANWTENLNAPLEGFFEKLGSEQDVKISLLAFKVKKKIKAVMVVPALHPGPFKNLGSSLLPYMIQTALERKLQSLVSVPHGLVGHELDLSSQLQNEKVVEGVLGCISSSLSYSKATSFVRARKNMAKASCQMFGDCALFTLTIAPKNMEDLPQELDSFIVSEAEKRGLSALVIDAHNSVQGPFDVNEAVESLRRAAVASLEGALAQERFPFEVGTSKVVPKEFTVKEGMGVGGINVIVTKVGDKKAAYVTIDGNNMVSGLRERVISMLREIGIDDAEVLTTDTHMVCGVVLTERGYHPIGEAMDQEKLINYVREATMNALDTMEPAEASWCTKIIPNIKVIGGKQIEALCLLADETARQAKKLALSLFSVAGVLLILLLFMF
jgi:putative membrane protein